MTKILSNVVEEIKTTIGNRPIESGGIIGGERDTITAFCFDNGEHLSEYIPNVSFLNSQIKAWHEKDIEFYGIIHSHPSYSPKPSNEDLAYALKIKEKNPFLSHIIFPILIKNEKNEPIIFFYELINQKFVEIDVKIIN